MPIMGYCILCSVTSADCPYTLPHSLVDSIFAASTIACYHYAASRRWHRLRPAMIMLDAETVFCCTRTTKTNEFQTFQAVTTSLLPFELSLSLYRVPSLTLLDTVQFCWPKKGKMAFLLQLSLATHIYPARNSQPALYYKRSLLRDVDQNAFPELV